MGWFFEETPEDAAAIAYGNRLSTNFLIMAVLAILIIASGFVIFIWIGRIHGLSIITVITMTAVFIFSLVFMTIAWKIHIQHIPFERRRIEQFWSDPWYRGFVLLCILLYGLLYFFFGR